MTRKTRKFQKCVEDYANNVECNHSTFLGEVEHEDEILTILNMTEKSTSREIRRERKREAKEHQYEIVFFGRKAKERSVGKC